MLILLVKAEINLSYLSFRHFDSAVLTALSMQLPCSIRNMAEEKIAELIPTQVNTY